MFTKFEGDVLRDGIYSMLSIMVEQRVQQYAQVADGRIIVARWRNTAVKKGRHNGTEALDANPGCAKSFRAKVSMHALDIVSNM